MSMPYSVAQRIVARERLIFGDQRHIDAVNLCELVKRAQDAGRGWASAKKIRRDEVTASRAVEIIQEYEWMNSA